MPYMILNKFPILLCSVLTVYVHSQTNNLTSSPYSLFGLGVESNSGLGKNKGLGNSGIARKDDFAINDLNPASLASVNKQMFIFDIGSDVEVDFVSDRSNDETRFAGNFSNVGFGFNANGKLGVSLTLQPATNVGYNLLGLVGEIEGSTDQFISNVAGSGGINNISVAAGYPLTHNLNVGTRLYYLFGRIEETESVLIEDTFLTIEEISLYKNFQMGVGMQYDVKGLFAIGATVDFPTVLNAVQDRTVQKTLDFMPTITEATENEPIADFSLPLDIGMGISTQKLESFSISVDYRKRYWGSTGQEDDIGEYVDQEILAFGAAYVPNSNGLNYWDHVNFRMGLSYDSGYLKVNDTAIENYSLSLGIGFPIGKKGSSINLAYNYKQNGTFGGVLVEESINTFSLNFTLSDIWFQKRFYD
ncbi:MAG: hypothetical protein AAFP76_10910 [Bacteroidota bacterium]